MNFYDLKTLVRLGSIVQWAVIILILLAGSFQISKFVIDKRIGDRQEQMDRNRRIKYEKTITNLKSRIIEQNEQLDIEKDNIERTIIPQSLIPKMINELSKYKESSVRITCGSNDEWVLSFSQQLKAIFINAGWKVKGIHKAAFSRPLKGIVISLNKKEQKLKANYVFSILKSLELQGIGKLNKDQEEDLGIIIGSKE